MKHKLLALAFGAVVSATAVAGPISLQAGGVYLQFTNLEQTALGVIPGVGFANNTASCAGCSGPEGNWGIAQVSVVRPGKPNPAGAVAGQVGNDMDASGVSYFLDQVFPTAGGQITAMFHGAVQTGITFNGTVASVTSTGGFIDLYWDQPGLVGGGTIMDIANELPGSRTTNSTFPGFTDGIKLVTLAFASGIDSASATTFIQGTIDTSLTGATGSADSYANVYDSSGNGTIGVEDGAWAYQLDTDWFGVSVLGVNGTRDVRFSNKVDSNSDWNGAAGTGVLGQTSNDPARGFAVPEPGSLALVGLGLLSAAGIRRRRKV